jgi:hypothetical protein
MKTQQMKRNAKSDLPVFGCFMFILFSLLSAGYCFSQNDRDVKDPEKSIYLVSGVYGGTKVHLVWENYNGDKIKEVFVERSAEGEHYTTIGYAIIADLMDIHAYNYPEGIKYFGNILYSTEHGSGRYIYNDVIDPSMFNISKVMYRIRMVSVDGRQYISQSIGANSNSSGSGFQKNEKERSGEIIKFKNNIKPGCPPVDIPPYGYSPTSTVTTTYGPCCYYVTTLYTNGVIQTPCGGGSFAWCCDSLPGASACPSGHISDPCCVHYCNQYWSCSCTPWDCCVLATQPVITQSVQNTVLAVNSVINNESCSGMNDGSIIVGVSNGKNPITYIWSNSGSTTDTLSNLTAGVYSVTVTDSNNCQNISSFSVYDNRILYVTLGSFPDFCISDPPYTLGGGNPAGGIFSGTGVSGNQFDPVTTGAGLHDILYTYTDSTGCTNSDTSNITVNTLPADAGAITGPVVVCRGQNSVTYQVPAITGATSYFWTFPSGVTGLSITNILTVDFSMSAVPGNITVQGINSCGTGIMSTLYITVLGVPPTPIITMNGSVLHSSATSGNQWYDQNGPINGATGQDYIWITPGDYYVIVTINGCSSAPSNIINPLSVGIGSIEKDKTINIYPNPVSNELIIEMEGNKDILGFEILNSIGQVVYKGTLQEKTVVPTTDFAAGIYLFKLESGKAFELKIFVRE